MDNMEQAISGILSDPDAMKKIQELSQSLGLSSSSNNSSQNNSPTGKSDGLDLSALTGMLQGISPQKSTTPSLPFADNNTMSAVTKLMPLLSGMNQEDETSALLKALRPFLSENKCRRLEEAGRMLKIMRILPKIRNSGLF